MMMVVEPGNLIFSLGIFCTLINLKLNCSLTLSTISEKEPYDNIIVNSTFATTVYIKIFTKDSSLDIFLFISKNSFLKASIRFWKSFISYSFNIVGINSYCFSFSNSNSGDGTKQLVPKFIGLSITTNEISSSCIFLASHCVIQKLKKSL